MTNHTIKASPLIHARVAAILYLGLGVLGAFSMLYVPSILFVPGDATATANNIAASELLFRISFVTDLISQTVFILLVLVLYKLLRPVNPDHAALMVIFALVGIPIAMLNLINQAAVLLLLSGADYLTGFEPDQLDTLVMLFLDLQKHGVNIAQIFWGLWLFPLGYLVYKSGFLPRALLTLT